MGVAMEVGGPNIKINTHKTYLQIIAKSCASFNDCGGVVCKFQLH